MNKSAHTEKPAVWRESVNGPELLNELEFEFRKYIVLPKHGATILALWTLHTYCFNLFQHSPILLINSPTARCGKTLVLQLLKELAENPKMYSDMTVASLFRIVSKYKPTMLMDEMDCPSGEQRASMRSVLNAGFESGGIVTRAVKDSDQVQEYEVYCPKALAGIGKYVSDTISDRSIRLNMQRNSKSLKLEKFRKCKFSPNGLQERCRRFVQDNSKALKEAWLRDPAMPKTLSARQEDIWAPLFAISEIVGGEWPKKTRAAAASMAENSTFDGNEGVLVLDAVRQYISIHNEPTHFSADICDWMNGQEELPFKDLRNGKGIDQRRLSTKLGEFNIYATTIRKTPKICKGYKAAQFEHAFREYLPARALHVTTTEKTGSNSSSPALHAEPRNATKSANEPEKTGLVTCNARSGGYSEVLDKNGLENRHLRLNSRLGMLPCNDCFGPFKYQYMPPP